MAYSAEFTCDICGAERSSENHWYQAGISKGFPIGISIFKFYELDARDSNSRNKHLCGEACVHKFISQNLASLYGRERSDAAMQDTGRVSGCSSVGLGSENSIELSIDGPFHSNPQNLASETDMLQIAFCSHGVNLEDPCELCNKLIEGPYPEIHPEDYFTAGATCSHGISIEEPCEECREIMESLGYKAIEKESQDSRTRIL